MQNHLFVPLFSPLIGAVLATLIGHWPRLTRRVVYGTVLINLIYGMWLLPRVALDGRQTTRVGTLDAPYGIGLVADGLSAVLVVLAALVTLNAVFFGFATLDRQREQFFFYPLVLLVLLSVNGIVLTGDVFNLYIWFEVLLVAALCLILLGGRRSQLQTGLRYVVLTLVGNLSFLIGCGLLYGIVGTLNIAQASLRLGTLTSPGVSTILASLFLIAWCTQAAIFPLCFWLPGSFDTPPVAVAVLFGGLLTKVGIYALYRCFSLMYPADLVLLGPVLLLLAGMTMLVGILAALVQTDIRRMLSFLLVSQSGYMLMALGLGTEAGLAAGIMLLVHDSIVQSAIFCAGGILEFIARTGNIRQMGGLAQREPVLATVWLIAALALVGIPPLGGFFARLALVQAALQQSAYGIVTVALLTNVLALLPFVTIWHEVFWKPHPAAIPPPHRVTPDQFVPAAVLVSILLIFVLGIGSVVDYSLLAAQQARDAAGYQRDVLGILAEPEPAER